MPEPTEKKKPVISAPTGMVVLVIAVVILLVFAVLALWMLGNTDVNEVTWARRVYVFGTFEAIVFAAVGWLFGREVHREQAAVAAKDATRAKGEATAARTEAAVKSEEAATTRAKAQALAAAVRTSSAPASRTGGSRPVGLEEPAAAATGGGLRALADELFPPA